jgi:hypothetical protein
MIEYKTKPIEIHDILHAIDSSDLILISNFVLKKCVVFRKKVFFVSMSMTHFFFRYG